MLLDPMPVLPESRPEVPVDPLVSWMELGRARSRLAGTAFWIPNGTLESPVACETPVPEEEPVLEVLLS